MLLGLNAGLYGDVSLSAAGLDVMGFAAVGLGVIYLIGPLKLGASIASIPCWSRAMFENVAVEAEAD